MLFSRLNKPPVSGNRYKRFLRIPHERIVYVTGVIVMIRRGENYIIDETRFIVALVINTS